MAALSGAAANSSIISNSSTNKSGGNLNSATDITSPNGKIKNEVDASELPRSLGQIIDLGFQKDYILSPEKLARLMVTVESHCGKKSVGADKINAIFREPLFIANYQGTSAMVYKKINMMERFCEPFMQHHLDSKILDELLQKVMREYAKVADKVTKLSENLRPVEQVNHPEVVALMTGGPLNAIKSLFSPRSKSTSGSTAKHVDASAEDGGFHEEETRKSKMQRNRIARLNKFSKTVGLNSISTNFCIFIRNKIIDLNANDHNLFTKVPVSYCHQQLKIFTVEEGAKIADPELIKKIEQSLNSYSENLESDSDEEKSPYKSSLQGLAPASSSGDILNEATLKKHGDTAAKLSLAGEDKKINENNSADQAESNGVSEKTESDSSTSVETEQSDD